jgi:hypothetical protein
VGFAKICEGQSNLEIVQEIVKDSLQILVDFVLGVYEAYSINYNLAC